MLIFYESVLVFDKLCYSLLWFVFMYCTYKSVYRKITPCTLISKKFFSVHYLLFQKVIQVNNYYSHEQTVFNLLRSKRPTSKTNEGIRDYIERLDIQTKKICDFCQYKTNTAEDIFGRFVWLYNSAVL
jgi:hypothetical protein